MIFLPGTWKGFETASTYAAWNFLKNCAEEEEEETIRRKRKYQSPKLKIKKTYTCDMGVSDIQISSDHDELHFCISQVTITTATKCSE